MPTLSWLAVGLWLGVLGLVTLPAWYWSLPDGAELGILNVDALPFALAATVAGLALLPFVGSTSGIAEGEGAFLKLAPHVS